MAKNRKNPKNDPSAMTVKILSDISKRVKQLEQVVNGDGGNLTSRRKGRAVSPEVKKVLREAAKLLSPVDEEEEIKKVEQELGQLGFDYFPWKLGPNVPSLAKYWISYGGLFGKRWKAHLWVVTDFDPRKPVYKQRPAKFSRGGFKTRLEACEWIREKAKEVLPERMGILRVVK